LIGLPRGVSVYAFDAPCDMRKSFDTLTGLVTEHMKHDVLTGDLYLFVSRDRKRARVLYFDGTGICLFAKRLEKGQFTATWKRASRRGALDDVERAGTVRRGQRGGCAHAAESIAPTSRSAHSLCTGTPSRS
jgi:transposase